MTLEAASYRVLSAEDGARGMAAANQQKADLVITDLNMPVMDGIALITQLRALPQYKFTPILMLTTVSQEDRKIAGRRAGATGWIVKPFDPARFIAVIQKVCPPG
jgi:two-component system chemotaxis response regulator CheY